MIVTYHPVDPDTDLRFDMVEQSINIARYGWRMIDCCFCFQFYKQLKQCFKSCKKCYNCGKIPKQKKKKTVDKPDTMADVPDSPESSASDYEDPYYGLQNGAIYLGEGAVLYLQIMKTIMYLFLVLTIINLPPLMLYPNLTNQNNYSHYT